MVNGKLPSHDAPETDKAAAVIRPNCACHLWADE
jgi:hypothetical protein